MRNMRRMQLQAGRESSIARGNSPNEPTAESVKNGTNHLQNYVCAAESAQVESANEPTRRSEVPVRLATDSPFLRASQTDVLCSVRGAQSLWRLGQCRKMALERRATWPKSFT